MALTATCILECWTTGHDTNNGGGFDPGQTAGMLTDGAATSATGNSPVFSSASYNFVAGDVGAWIYIASGTNWTPGWYKIASVATNAATLSAAIGAGVLKGFAGLTTAAGCATTASPTGATWSIDYSQQAAAQFTYTDITYVSGTTFTSAGNPFGKQQVGNIVRITGGTNFTVGRYIITSVTGTTATFNATACSVASSNGAGGLGGAFLTPGGAMTVFVGSNWLWIKSGTYTLNNTTQNTAEGPILLSVSGSASAVSRIRGFGTTRCDDPLPGSGNQPLIQASAGGFTAQFIIQVSGNHYDVGNLKLDGVSKTTVKGIYASSQVGRIDAIDARNCPDRGILPQSDSTLKVSRCYATNCGTAGFDCTGGVVVSECVADTNTALGFKYSNACTFENCIANGNTSHGFGVNTNDGTFIGCTAYGNGGSGFNSNGQRNNQYKRCISYGNSAYGFDIGTGDASSLDRCAYGNNTSGNVNATTKRESGSITLTGDPFTNAAGKDFSLDNTSNEGAACRGITIAFPVISTTGYPDTGAVQHQDSGGSAGILSTSNMTGNMI